MPSQRFENPRHWQHIYPSLTQKAGEWKGKGCWAHGWFNVRNSLVHTGLLILLMRKLRPKWDQWPNKVHIWNGSPRHGPQSSQCHKWLIFTRSGLTSPCFSYHSNSAFLVFSFGSPKVYIWLYPSSRNLCAALHLQAKKLLCQVVCSHQYSSRKNRHCLAKLCRNTENRWARNKAKTQVSFNEGTLVIKATDLGP